MKDIVVNCAAVGVKIGVYRVKIVSQRPVLLIGNLLRNHARATPTIRQAEHFFFFLTFFYILFLRKTRSK